MILAHAYIFDANLILHRSHRRYPGKPKQPKMSAQEEPASARCDTGTSGLNQILDGAVLRAHSIWFRVTPAGLVTLALQFPMAGARAGESCLYIRD